MSSNFWKALFGDAEANILLGSPVKTSGEEGARESKPDKIDALLTLNANER